MKIDVNSKVIKELSKVTGVTQGKKETDDKYILRLIGQASQLGDGDWVKLSDSTQKWVNEAIAAVNEKSDIQPPSEDTGEKEKAPKKLKRRPRRSKVSKEPEDPKEPEEPELPKETKKERRRKKKKSDGEGDEESGPSSVDQAREFFILNPEKGPDELSGYLEETGGKPLSASTAKSIKRQVTRALRILHRLGVLNEKKLEAARSGPAE